MRRAETFSKPESTESDPINRAWIPTATLAVTLQPCSFNEDCACANGFPNLTEDLDVNIPRPSLRTEMYISWGRGSLGSVCLGFEVKVAWSGGLNGEGNCCC